MPIGANQLRLEFNDPTCPAGQTADCTEINGGVVPTFPLTDVCCTCSGGGLIHERAVILVSLSPSDEKQYNNIRYLESYFGK